MTFKFLVLASLLISSSAFARSFTCSNQPEKTWATYYAVMGTIESTTKLVAVTYGTFEGSIDAGEMEPSDVTEFEVLVANPALAAKSAQWRNVPAYDVTTPELGTATLLFDSVSATARLKVNGRDVRLACGYAD